MHNSINSRLDTGVLRLAEQSKPASGTAAGEAGKDREATEAKPADQLDLTERARSLKALEEQIRNAPDVDSPRVAELKQALKDGTYEINPSRIADKLLALDELLPK